jgi:YidC/Oxa1 family membrane protein insertase
MDEEKYLLLKVADSGSGSVAPNHYTVFSMNKTVTLQPGQDSLTVPLTWTDNSGLVIKIIYL